VKQLRALLALFVFLALAFPATAQEAARGSGRITAIEVQGTQRIDPDTVRSYMLVQRLNRTALTAACARFLPRGCSGM
jgi:outer membrane protein assembly factor BamA